ncbi:lipid A export permease/ATP-binding protein MsbA [Hahella aquimaris]|uniref:lipid A export permease/ATP-binding protein MsbA n=1 Tax=Hahella sp. HNIBRBA332 TaxID=3015983 RepID=UPI00273AB361|nr:lipid A export permease/ATP-binding protein MsbA [Hahella sp. HNIBRBA332]WLQ16880.1 lipid A export permease/ATP-binding protein MsbA [Hahella sp. HNIBRBA332]
MSKVAKQYAGAQVYGRLLSYLKPLWKVFALAVLGNVIYALASAAMADATKYIVAAIETPSPEGRFLVPMLIIGIFALRGLGSFCGGYFMARVARGIVHRMRLELFRHLTVLPCRFFDSNSTGHLVSRITYNVDQVTGAATNAITVILREGFTVIGLMGYMIYVSWKLTLLFLVLGPIIGILISYVSKRFRRISRRIQSSMGDVTHVASESIGGYRVMRTFGGEEYEFNRFMKASEYNITQALKMSLTQALSTPIIQLVISVFIALLVWLALSPEVRGNMSTGEFLAYITAATTCAKPIRQLTEVNAVIQRGISAAQDVFMQLDEPVEKDNGSYIVDKAQGRLEFKSLGFAYGDEGRPALQDINLVIEPGETVALVGRSGSGKSTLVSLLPRFYDYEKGEILLDGKPLKDFTLSSLRRQISIVTQQVVLFNDTVTNNIAYGALADATPEQVREAAKSADALDFIEQLEQGFDTLLGENGTRLSGGQRQRMVIARALLKDSPILILDEATSALDTHAERNIQSALETLMQGRTTLVVAHRLSTIENADKIVVMDQGRIVEVGTHRELIEKDGAYAALHKLQFSEADT